MDGEANIRILFEKTNYPELKQNIEALGVQHDVNKMAFVQITNYLTTKVSKFENNQSQFRGVVAEKVDKPDPNGKGPKNGGMRVPDGSLFTLFYPNWRELSDEKHNKLKYSMEKKSSPRLVEINHPRITPS